MPPSRSIAGAVAIALSIAPAAAAGSRLHLVVAPERFRDALAPYLAWRAGTPQNDGVAFESLESMLDGMAPSDRGAPERLKRRLFDRWSRGALGSCLLVGDGDTLPVFFMTLDRVEPAAANWAFYPSDLYYADLAGPDGAFQDWNGRRDGVHEHYRGEVHGEANKDGPINADGMDLDPEIALGRWPVSTPEDAAALALKTVAWERSLTAGAAETGSAVFAVGGWVDVRPRVRSMTVVLDGCIAGGARAFIHDDDGSAAPDASAMRAELARGTRLLMHTGHGQPWAWEHCLSEEMVDQAKAPTDAAPPILVSAGCSTAEWTALPPYGPYLDERGTMHRGTGAGERFDAPPPAPAPIQAGEGDRSSFSERLLRRPVGGAIAVIGCSTGSQPCAVTLLEGFSDACADLARERGAPPTIGEAWRRAITAYRRRERLDALVPTESWYPPSIFFQPMKFVLLGDPALALPLRPPAALERPASR